MRAHAFRVLALGAALVAALGALVAGPGCGDAGGGVEFERFPQIEIEPPELDVPVPVANAPLGGSITHRITVRNTGQRDLVVSGIELEYVAPVGTDEAVPAFELVLEPAADPREAPVRVAPAGAAATSAEAFAFDVRFHRYDNVPRSARLVIRSDSRESPALEVVFTTLHGAPVVLLSTPVVDFGTVPGGASKEEVFTVLNNGTADLKLSGFQLIGQPGFAFFDPVRSEEWELGADTEDGVIFAIPHSVPPNGSMELAVRFSPRIASVQEAQLILLTNDPSASQVSLGLVANREMPAIRVTPDAIEFGETAIGGEVPLPVDISSRGTAPLEIVELSLDPAGSADFHLDFAGVPGLAAGEVPTEERPLRVEVNDAIRVHVVFTPDVEVRDEAGRFVADRTKVRLRSNAYESSIEMPVEGTGVIATCPTARAEVEEGEEVIPQTVLHLTSNGSFSSCGTLTRWEWTATQPDGSVSSFLPSPTFDSPTFEVDVAGRYEFCLEVVDSCGKRSCAPSCVEVLVVPDEALHVELLWTTPADLDPFDEGPGSGADLDLHFTHPYSVIGGEDLDGDRVPDGWFSQTFDCFWWNPQPDWGAFDEAVDDNPGLDRDDTNGWGPENVNLNVPEDFTNIPPERVGGIEPAYRVGVHYWDDHSLGASFATLRVFLYSTLVYEKTGVQLGEQDMWDALTIRMRGEAGEVTEVRETDGSLKITPGYEHPSFVAP